MNNYIFDNKTFVAKSLPHIAIRKYIYKKYDVTSLEEFFNGNKCYYSSNYARVELKSTEDFCVYIGYKNAPYRCGEKLCGCTKLNPQQFTYLITCAGMTEADAKTHLQKKARAGVNTSTDLGYFDDPQNNPFQKGFWIKKGYSEQQAQQKLDDRNDKTVATKAKNGYFDDPQNNPFQKGFWIKKGYSEQQAQQKVNSRNFWCKEFSGPEYHNPATVEFYIQKYGYDIGIERRNEIIKRATFQNSLAGHVARFGETDGRAKFLEKTLKNGGHNCSVSRAQKIFFKTLYKVLRRMNLIAAKQMHAGLVGSKEYSIRDDSEGYRYDCYIPEYALIIEFNGTLWHPRRDMMSEEKYKQWKMPYANNAGVTAAEKEAKDMKKLDLAKRLGYNILEVWDFDDVSVNIMKCLDKIQRIENGN